jgi:hypothetical protein
MRQATPHTATVSITNGAAQDALAQARAEIRAKMGGQSGLLRAHRLAVASLYAEHAKGFTLD